MLPVMLAVVTKVLLYVLILLVALWCWFQFSYRKILRAAAKIPCSLPVLPIIGHAHYTLGGYEKASQACLDLIESGVSEGLRVTCFWCGPFPLIGILDAEDIQKVLTSSTTSEKAHVYDYFKFAFGEGLLTAPWKLWKITRRHINPLFHPRNLEHLILMFNRNSEELVTVLSEHVSGDPVNVNIHTMDLALKSISNLVFGHNVEFNIHSQKFQGMIHVIELFSVILHQRLILIWLRFEVIFKFFKRNDVKALYKSLEDFLDYSLKTASLNPNANNEEIQNQDQLINTEDAVNFFDVYRSMQLKFPGFTEEDRQSELVTLFGGGTHTVALTVSSCLLALAYHQNIQDSLVKEIFSVVDEDSTVNSRDLLKMPYLDQVYKETLRFFSIIPVIARTPTEDIQLGSFTVPAGATVCVAIAGLNKNSKIYKNPNEFDPDHFSDENVEGRGKYDFIPFSGGPRNCIGKRYADLLVKIMIIHVVRKFKLSTNMDIYNLKKKLAMALVSSEGYHISLQYREQESA